MTKEPTMTPKQKAQYNWKRRNPWLQGYYNAKWRSEKDKSYTSRGIKMFLTKEEVKKLWDRDNASQMERPSIDRINGNGNYEFSNCRFIEMELNRNPKPVIMYREFKSIREAGRILNWDATTICEIANEKRTKPLKGYKFKFIDLAHQEIMKLIKDKMPKKKVDFEGYLMEKHAEQYIGTKDTMVDDFGDWIQGLDIDTLIKYGNKYTQKAIDDCMKVLNI